MALLTKIFEKHEEVVKEMFDADQVSDIIGGLDTVAECPAVSDSEKHIFLVDHACADAAQKAHCPSGARQKHGLTRR